MRINMNDPNPSTFFAWPANKTEEDGGIFIKVLNNAELTKIDKLTTTKKKKFRGNTQYDDIKVDEKLRDELIWDYCITGWENLQDSDGIDIPCNKEKKIFLMNEHLNFSVFVAECLEKLTDFESTKVEEEVKN